MTVHVCDRCGKTLSRKEHDEQHLQIIHACDRSSGFRWDHAWRDLCRNCSDELEEWLKAGDQNAPE